MWFDDVFGQRERLGKKERVEMEFCKRKKKTLSRRELNRNDNNTLF
jgi:hypothetical protein